MDTLPPGCWLGFGAHEPKDVVLGAAVKWFAVPLDKLEWKWTAGAWLVRIRQEEDDEEGIDGE